MLPTVLRLESKRKVESGLLVSQMGQASLKFELQFFSKTFFGGGLNKHNFSYFFSASSLYFSMKIIFSDRMKALHHLK